MVSCPPFCRGKCRPNVVFTHCNMARVVNHSASVQLGQAAVLHESCPASFSQRSAVCPLPSAIRLPAICQPCALRLPSVCHPSAFHLPLVSWSSLASREPTRPLL